VLRIVFPYRAALYVPLVLLHGSLALRALGDFLSSGSVRAAGAAGNAAALVLFLVIVASPLLSRDRAGATRP